MKNKSLYTTLHWFFFALTCMVLFGALVKQVQKSYEVSVDLNVSEASPTTAVRLSPSNLVVANNSQFTVDVMIDTGGESIDGLDIYYLRFNPSILQVVDQNSSITGVQIAPTTTLPLTSANLVNNSTGQIQFSQTTSGGTTYLGAGKVATITFRAVSGGNTSLSFDFSPGVTVDTNVSVAGVDKLSVVQGATISIDSTIPSVNITKPTSGSTVSGTTTIEATATDNFGVAGVQFKVNGSNMGSEDTSSPYSVSWNTTSLTNGSYSVSATARDSSGLTNISTTNVTVSNVTSKSTTLTLDYEGKTSNIATGKVSVLNSNKVLLQELPFTTSSTGQATVSIDVSPQSIYLKIVVPGYLTRLMGPYSFSTLPSTITVPILLAGDFNSDNIINSLDYSYMNARWFGSDTLADINKDGIINTIDFSVLNKNWFVSGQN